MAGIILRYRNTRSYGEAGRLWKSRLTSANEARATTISVLQTQKMKVTYDLLSTCY